MLHLSFLLLQSAVNWLQCKNEHDNVIVTGNGRCAEAQNKEAKSSPHKGSDFASQNKEDFMIWEDVLAKFKELFGVEGEIGVYFAPGRVNMIGEHTDYNGGHVFPCALTIGTYGVARKRDDKKLRFYSMNFEQLGVIESSVEGLKPEKEADWTNYPK